MPRPLYAIPDGAAMIANANLKRQLQFGTQLTGYRTIPRSYRSGHMTDTKNETIKEKPTWNETKQQRLNELRQRDALPDDDQRTLEALLYDGAVGIGGGASDLEAISERSRDAGGGSGPTADAECRDWRPG